MSIDDLRTALKRRGYTLEVSDGKASAMRGEYPVMSWCAFDGIVPNDLQEEMHLLDQIVGCQHVLCVHCDEPLLYSAKHVDEWHQCLKWYCCRSPQAGPDSEDLKVCPGCGIGFGYPPPVKGIDVDHWKVEAHFSQRIEPTTYMSGFDPDGKEFAYRFVTSCLAELSGSVEILVYKNGQLHQTITVG